MVFCHSGMLERQIPFRGVWVPQKLVHLVVRTSENWLEVI
jgi:hypothetical protein